MNTEAKLIDALTGIVGIQRYLVGQGEYPTAGEKILKSADFKAFKESKADMFRHEIKTAILSTSAINDPLVQSHYPAIDPGTRRPLTVRQLLRSFPISQGAVEVPVLSSKTNNAAVQLGGSPEAYENVTLGESAMTFSNSFTEVRTLGHWIPVSSQLLEDSGQLDSFLTGELSYGLEAAVEAQLLNGTGSNGQLSGLLTGATAYSPNSPAPTGEAGIIRDAMRQVQAADFSATGVILNPQDWYDLDVALTSDYRLIDSPRLWGVPVTVSNSIASGTFLVGDFTRCGAIYQRQGVTVEMARHDDDAFQRNVIVIRAVERLALVVVNSLALVTGTI